MKILGYSSDREVAFAEISRKELGAFKMLSLAVDGQDYIYRLGDSVRDVKEVDLSDALKAVCLWARTKVAVTALQNQVEKVVAEIDRTDA